MHYFFYTIVFLSLFGCKNALEQNEQEEKKIIASAGEESLTEEAFVDDFIVGGKGKDSVQDAKRTIEAWATESLFYQEALEKLTDEEIDIKRQVENYKRSLVNYIYQSKLIEANLDTAVSMDEIEV